MLAPAFSRLRVKLNTAFAHGARRMRSPIPTPLKATLPRHHRVGQGRSGFLVLAAIAIICALLVIGVPKWFGVRAERTYREVMRQTISNGDGIKLDSYQRGWFSSRAVITVPLGSHCVTLTQHIHHGPLVFYDGWHVAFPVAAVIETDPPPALRAYLDRTLGEAPLLIETVVAMNGALDTHIRRPASVHSAPGLTVKFRGFDFHLHRSSDARRMSGRAPGITATGGFGEAQVAGMSLNAESHRQGTELWLGHGGIKMERVLYSIFAHGKRPSLSGLIQDISISVRTALEDGRVDLRLRLGAGKVSGRTLTLGPVMIEEHLGHLAPEPFEQFRKDAASISLSPADDAAHQRMLRALKRKILIAIVKQTPTFAINFNAAGAGGKAVGQMRFVIAKDFASDPLINDETVNGKELAARAWRKYIEATAKISIPAALLAELASNAQIDRLQAKGILVRDGADYTCHATYRKGEWTVNGKMFHAPAVPGRPRGKCAPRKVVLR